MYVKLSITRFFWHLAIFGIFVLLLTDEYLPHKVLDCKVIDPQKTISSYCRDQFRISRFSTFACQNGVSRWPEAGGRNIVQLDALCQGNIYIMGRSK